MNKLCLRAGHGSPDGDKGAPGCDGVTNESDINIAVTSLLANKLAGVIPCVIAPRTYDTNANYTFAKNQGCDMIIFIHCNAGAPTATGTEVYYNAPAFEGYATSLLSYYSRSMGLKKRWATLKPAVGAMDNTDIPILLIELGFMSNKSDLNLLKTQQEYIVDSLIHWLLGQCYQTIREYTFEVNVASYVTNDAPGTFPMVAPVKVINGRTYLPLKDIANITKKRTGYLPALKKVIFY